MFTYLLKTENNSTKTKTTTVYKQSWRTDKNIPRYFTCVFKGNKRKFLPKFLDPNPSTLTNQPQSFLCLPASEASIWVSSKFATWIYAQRTYLVCKTGKISMFSSFFIICKCSLKRTDHRCKLT